MPTQKQLDTLVRALREKLGGNVSIIYNHNFYGERLYSQWQVYAEKGFQGSQFGLAYLNTWKEVKSFVENVQPKPPAPATECASVAITAA